MTPRVSICGAANRPQLFEWHLASILEHNKTPVEFVFVGHVEYPADWEGRWENFRYYRAPADVPPAACAAWALLQGTGDLLFHAVDDYFWDPGLLDQLVAAYDAADDVKLMPSPRYLLDQAGVERDQTEGLRLFDDPALPYLPLDGLISRDFYLSLGGLDRRFRGVMQFVDLCARAVVAGGTTIFPGGAIHERRTVTGVDQESICVRHWDHDRPLLESFWVAPGERYEGGARVVPLEAYTPADLAAIGERLVLCS